MITSTLYGNSISQTIEPEWFKAERYDYCDSFFERTVKSVKKENSFIVFFKSIFQK